MHLDLSMTMTKCFHSSCKKEVPTACLRAISMAIKGEPIAVVMYLQFPKGKGKCSLCDQEEVYIELAICKHGACKSCVMKMYNKSKNGFVKCEYWLCDQRVPEVCLKRVFNDQLLLKIDTNYFDEISKKDDITRKVQINPDDSLDVGSSKALDGQHETDHMETERVIDLLCPSYGERLSCSYCSRMAVIKFSECRHGWCLRCLKFLTKTQKDDKMHCKYCTSCGSIGNVRRFIRNCETDGLLVPSYLKPISGTTSCYLCRKREAILEGTECGHRFCDSCLNLSTRLQMMTSKCPALGCESVEYYQANEKKGKQIAIQPSKCVCCSKMEAADLMTECGHASCKNCIQSIFPCPIKTCKSFIDSATSEFLSKHIISNKGMLFIGKQVKTRDVCCMCSGDQKASKSEEVVQIRRCNHLICTNCLTKLKEKCKGTGISTCPSDGCLELFFIPQMAPSQLQTEDYIGSEENSNPAAILYEKATSSGGAMKVIGKVKSYLFPSLKVDDYRVKQNGLPNLGLSCYKNSVLQVLAETPNFFSMLRSMNTQSKENWTFTLSEILWRVLKESSSKQDIEDWLLRFQVEFASIDNSFVEYTQHDSLSFLTSILSGITDEALRREKEGLDKVIDPTDIFRGTMHDQYTCCNCKKKEHHGESTFFSLPLPTVKTDNPKIGECLYQFFDSEIIKDVFPCSHCKHHTVQKEIQIKKYPDVLVLQLGMIYENMDYFERVQRTPKFWETFAGLSNNIHLGKINKEEFSKYKLYGVIVHSGGLTGGHYYTYVKKMNDENWERRDDSYVRQVKLKEVLLSEAYILFYHKIEKASPV
ncbi:uncharacterized protein LOC133178503 [Saccostrea echinata]|uniref:uncharacterized protein LOC133178503 n=1 Tax=Saccostrea echinata TaxID=191078 RepID=UPI002A802C9B|nr:uncharacterized protein LOC133178503 [Saccostrea echinata]